MFSGDTKNIKVVIAGIIISSLFVDKQFDINCMPPLCSIYSLFKGSEKIKYYTR